ncbi:partial Bifunctional polyhydroxybutyrate synthase / ABC transporter periplasmic binding protein, partial [Anaerolineae bacterium]
MKKYAFNLIALFVLGSLVLSACGGAAPATEAPSGATEVSSSATEAPAAATEAPSMELEGALSIVAWAGYIERGETDPAYDWVTSFEAETGCIVSVKTAATSDEMVALMNEGGFDLVTASGDASNRLISGGRVQPIDISRVPSYDKVDSRLQNAPWQTVDDVHYGVPYSSG